ncbi:MAG: YkgJ family cysteine cluster protein [Candidatus Micrarchaeota archaeon]
MRGPCSFCKSECCKTYTISVTIFDIIRIMEATGKPWQDFAVLHQARLLSFDPDTTIDMEDDGWTYLLGIKSHPCVFLEKNLCSIHNAAPLSCKRYPFRLDGSLNARFCPLLSNLLFRFKKPDIPARQMEGEISLHKDVVKEWNKKPGKKADCIQFLLEKSKGLNGTSSI